MRPSKQLATQESQSHQTRFERSKMLLGLEGRESHVMPDLVHKLIRANGGLDGDSDCITWLFLGPPMGTNGVGIIEVNRKGNGANVSPSSGSGRALPPARLRLTGSRSRPEPELGWIRHSECTFPSYEPRMPIPITFRVDASLEIRYSFSFHLPPSIRMASLKRSVKK